MSKDIATSEYGGPCRRRAAVASVLILLCSMGLPTWVQAADSDPAAGTARVGAITIEVDPRVELIGIVFRLAGSFEYRQCRIQSYVADTDRHFAGFSDHPAVKMAARLRDTRGMSYDGPMSLALYIDRDLRPLKSFEQWPWGLDGRWQKDETVEFLEKLRQFAAETEFDAFFRKQEPVYRQGVESCHAIMAQHDLTAWFDAFFGIGKGDELTMVLGYTNGSSYYGLRFTTETTVRKVAIVGMEFCDAQGGPVFDPRQLVMAAHEFCHSFTNPVVNEYMDELRPAGQRFYDARAPRMRSIGYQRWQSVMYELAVRACVASFTRTVLEPAYPGLHRLYLQREAGFGFDSIEDLDNLLKSYESHRDKYPTFESFFPEFIAFFNAYGT